MQTLLDNINAKLNELEQDKKLVKEKEIETIFEIMAKGLYFGKVVKGKTAKTFIYEKDGYVNPFIIEINRKTVDFKGYNQMTYVSINFIDSEIKDVMTKSFEEVLKESKQLLNDKIQLKENELEIAEKEFNEILGEHHMQESTFEEALELYLKINKKEIRKVI